MKHLPRTCIAAWALSALFVAPADVGATSLDWRWSTKLSDNMVRTIPAVFADFDGNGRKEIATIEAPIPEGQGAYRLRVRSTLTGEVEFDSGLLAMTPHSLEVRDVDQDGLPDLTVFGPAVGADSPNYLLFGVNGFWRLKDFCRFASLEPTTPRAFGQVHPDAQLDLIVVATDLSGFRVALQVHAYTQAGLWADITTSGVSALVLEDADGNGLQEIYLRHSGTISAYAHPQALTGVPVPATTAPAGLALAQPFPNPARGATSVAFTLAERAAVTLRVVDAAGRQVRTLTPGALEAGSHTLAWDGRDDEGRSVAPGVYWLDVDAAGQRASRKVVHLR